MSLKALVIDDEELARRRVLDFIDQNQDVVSVGEAGDPREAIELILRDRPDLVFLDIQMPELNGFAVLDAVKSEYLPAVIFTTAYDEHAIRAFEVRAVDYLLKPFSKNRFDEAVRRLKTADSPVLRAAIRSMIDEVRAEHSYPEKMPFKTNGRIVIVSTDKIEWIEAERDYIRIHTLKESYLVRETMTNIEGKLFAKKFVRIHRSTIINVDYINELKPTLSGEYLVKLRSGTELTLSRSNRDLLSRLIPNFAVPIE